MKIIDLTGKKFGEWTVVSKVECAKPVKWNCVCSCGEEREVVAQALRRGDSTSCGSGIRHSDRKTACRGTTDEFIEKATAKHGDDYNYSKVDYVNAKTKVIISCNKCGSEFMQAPTLHLNNRGGCKVCAALRSRVPAVDYTGKKFGKLSVIEWKGGKWLCSCGCGKIVSVATTHLTTGATRSCGCERLWKEDEFLLQATQTHGDVYDYSEVNYTTFCQPVTIRCKKHDYIFNQSPQAHVGGKGCMKCGWERTKEKQTCTREDFIVKAKAVHGEKYSYFATDYKNVTTKVRIKCKSCGSNFLQSPNAHLAGKGCVTCNKSGYDTTRPGYMYVMACEDFVKIGITNKEPDIRLRTIRNSSGKDIKIVDSFLFYDGQFCSDLETKLLRILRRDYSNPDYVFDGSTEAFLGADAEDIVEMIQCFT